MHHWHHDKWSFARLWLIWSRGCISVCLQTGYNTLQGSLALNCCLFEGEVKVLTNLPSDPNSAPEGGIQIMNCVAILLTKSRTKFLVEYHSSCLESKFILQRLRGSCWIRLPWKKKRRRFNSVLVCWMFTETVKTPEGENMEHSEGSIKVFFRNQIEVKAGRGRFLGWPNHFGMILMKSPCFFLSSPPSSRIQSTSWTSTSSSVSSQQTATSHMVTDKDNYNKLSYVKSP